LRRLRPACPLGGDGEKTHPCRRCCGPQLDYSTIKSEPRYGAGEVGQPPPSQKVPACLDWICAIRSRHLRLEPCGVESPHIRRGRECVGHPADLHFRTAPAATAFVESGKRNNVLKDHSHPPSRRICTSKDALR
jgi:hypothetical protein